MDKNELLAILNDWNFWKGELRTGIQREGYLAPLKRFLGTNQVVVVNGARRAGKSFLMRQLAKSLIHDGEKTSQILMVNFEDPRFGPLGTRELDQIYETYLEFLNPPGKPYLFLDEIQEVEGWEKWVRKMHELEKAHLILSGSNAKLLSKDLATLLTGRHLSLTVFPLSFSEFLLFRDVEAKETLILPEKKTDLLRFTREMLEWGAFPEVVQSDEKKQILLQYFDDVLTKDLIKRYKIRKGEALRAVARFYSSNISQSMTFNSIEKFLKISADTIEKFSTYLEDAYLFFFVKRFSAKVSEHESDRIHSGRLSGANDSIPVTQMGVSGGERYHPLSNKGQEKSPRKVYTIDTGLANAVGFRLSPNLGRLAEGAVFLELARQRANNSDMEIFYWKDLQHREVDFVIKRGFEVTQLIQVCWDLSQYGTKERELTPLIKAMDELKLSEGWMITEDYEGVEEFKGKTIQFVPLWKWLLGGGA